MIDQDLMPRIRFNEFHEPWNHLSLGRLGAIKMCKRILKCQTSETGDIPFYKIGTFGKTPDAFISKETFEEYKKLYSFPKVGDILISAAGTIGRTVRFSGEDSYYQDSNIVWIDNDETTVINPFLEILYSVVNWNTDTTTIQRLYNDNLRQTTIFSPKSLIEQNKVGSIFHHIIEILTARQKELEKLENVKKACIEQMFPSKGETIPQLRFKGFDDEWKLYKLEDIGILICTSTLGYADLTENGKYPCILYGELYTKYDEIIMNVISHTDVKATEIKKNDILFPTSTTVDAISLIAPSCMNNDFAVAGGDMFIIRPYDHVDGNFVSYAINNVSHLKLSLAKKAQGLTIVHIHYNSIKDETILLPSIEEQKRISKYFRHMDELISAKRQEIEKLQNIKQALLDKMFV